MKKIFFAMAILWTAVACSIHEHRDLPVEKGCITLNFQVEEKVGVKGYMQVSEALISNLNVFVYDSENKLSECRYYPDMPEEVKINVNTKDEVSIYILANVGDYTSRKTLSDVGNMDGLVWQFSDISGIVTEDGGVPMSGRIEKRLFANEDDVTVTLTRLVAKFRIKVDTSLLDKNVKVFDIHKVRIRNVNSSVGFFSESRAEHSEDVIKDGGSREGAELDGLFEGGIDFYIPENAHGNLLSGNVDENRHIPPPQYADLCTYVEIVVKYRNTEHYNDRMVYRYYLHNGNTDNFDVLRNTMYVCRTWFHGSGINEDSWRIDVSGMKDLVTSINVFPDTLKFTEKGETMRLYADVQPASAEKTAVTWSSDNTGVATVDNDGNVTAIGGGTCRIIATATDGSGISGITEVLVDLYKSPQSIEITPKSTSIFKGEAITFSVKVFPEAADDKEVIWSSTDNTVAMVSQEGLVYGVDYGKAGIIATTKVGGLRDTAYVTVSEKIFRIDSLPDVLYPYYNTPYVIKYTADPESVPEFSLTHITGLAGVAYLKGDTIRARNFWMTNDAVSIYQLNAECNGIKENRVFEVHSGRIEIAEETRPFYVGIIGKLTLSSLVPADAAVQWTSSDNSIATVNAYGLITPKAQGTCTIRATSVTGLYDECTIEVKKPVLRFRRIPDIIQEGGVYDFSRFLASETTNDLAIRYRIVQGQEYVTLDGNTGVLNAVKRSGDDKVVLEAFFVSLPFNAARVTFSVLPAVTAVLDGPDKIVNTLMQSSKASNPSQDEPNADWSGIANTTKIAKGTNSRDVVIWEVLNEDGNRVNTVRVSSDGVVMPFDRNVSGTFYVRGWDAARQYSTEPIKIEIYKLLEYELGIDGLDTFKFDENRNMVYTLSIYARWYDSSFKALSAADQNKWASQKVLSYSEIPQPFYEITASGTAIVSDIKASPPRGPNGEYLDNKVTLPFNQSYLRASFTDNLATTPGISGQYYKMIGIVNGMTGYYFVRQRHSKYYNCDTGYYMD